MKESQQAQPEPLTPASPHPQPLPIEGRGVCSDPEILALVTFEPVPRKLNRRDGWTPDLQRRFIRLIVETGTPQRAAVAIGKRLSGIEAVYRDDEKGEFRAAWDAAVELGRARQLNEVNAETEARLSGGVAVPAHRRADAPSRPATDVNGDLALPGQVLNEHGEWEDEESYRRRGEEAKDSICRKLTRIRRLFLGEISHCPGKRAAFELLTELPIDWDLAAAGEPQPDEPWRTSNQRQPDMILMAESGWSFGDIGYGPNKKRELRDRFDAYRAEMGLPPIQWEESTERSDDGSPPLDGEGKGGVIVETRHTVGGTTPTSILPYQGGGAQRRLK